MIDDIIEPEEFGTANLTPKQRKDGEQALKSLEAQTKEANAQYQMNKALQPHWTQVKRPPIRKWQTEEDNNPASAEEQEK